MITTQHNDGTCFKLTIVYTDYEESTPFEPYIRYAEDFNEAFDHGVDEMNNISDRGQYITDFRIQDDSK